MERANKAERRPSLWESTLRRWSVALQAAWRRRKTGPDQGCWIVPGQIWACPYPHTDDALTVLRANNIRCVVNLHLQPHDPARLAEFGLTERHFPTADFCSPSPHALDAAAALAEQEIDAGYAIAVHCGGGLGRTGTVCACCLLRLSPHLDAADALTQVRAARPGSVETGAQERSVRDFALRR